jgi:hypothetical protein
MEARQGLAVAKRGVRGTYEVLWYRNGAGEVRSLVNRAVVAEYTPGLGWEDHGRLPDDVREYAQQIASVGEGAGRSEPQPKKSHAQIKREVDEVLTKAEIKPTSESSYLGGLRYKTEVYGPGGNRPIGEALSRPRVADPSAPKRQIPGIAAWNMFAGGTAAAPGKHGYSLHLPEGEYHVSPVSSQHGRHRGYSLMFAARQQPWGSHSGLWHDLGMHRSPAKAAVAARKHFAASY